MNVKFSKKYQPLFKLLNDDFHKEVDLVILTGGRSSAKSFATAVLSLLGLVTKGWNVLYTRFTNASIVDSIKPEVDEKIELLQYENLVNSTNSHIESGANRIAFKGIKTGSHQQTANLKSLSGFNVFVVDEAEELPDYDTFEKVYLSIRSKDKRNITILLLNPTTIHHWIYRKFYKDKDVNAGFNGIKDNIMYIHTSYLDVPKEYLAENIVNYYQVLKETDEKKYNQVVLGGWVEAVEGRVFSHFTQNTFDDFVKLNFPSFYGIDWGKNHGFGIIWCKYDRYTNTLYCHELNSKSENKLIEELSIEQRQALSKENGGIIIYTLNRLGLPKDKDIICDSAVPDNIEMLQDFGWQYAIGIDKPKGSVMAGISLLQSTNVVYTKESKGIDNDFMNYQYAKDRLGVVDDEVVKLNDDCVDPIRYVRRFLRNEGIG
jgi:phage terminase large subunit